MSLNRRQNLLENGNQTSGNIFDIKKAYGIDDDDIEFECKLDIIHKNEYKGDCIPDRYFHNLGHDGGDRGGEVVVCGTPEEVAKHPSSYTAQYLKQALTNHA